MPEPKKTILNPDDEFVKNLKKRIKDNGKYCLNKPKGNNDNKCPCKEYRETGDCACGMYIEDPNDNDKWVW